MPIICLENIKNVRGHFVKAQMSSDLVIRINTIRSTLTIHAWVLHFPLSVRIGTNRPCYDIFGLHLTNNLINGGRLVVDTEGNSKVMFKGSL